MARLLIPPLGSLQATGDLWEPYLLLDPAGEVVQPAAAYLRDLQAAGRAAATQRSYGMDLLRWFRFCWATGTAWDHATRREAADFCRWLRIAVRPARPHWRVRDAADAGAAACGGAAAASGPPAGSVTGEPVPARAYAQSTAAHCETVLRHFYDFHLEAGSGPMVNPFPLDRGRGGGRSGAHHNPMDLHRNQRSGLFRPRHVQRIPRSIPDEQFNELFARLTSHRDQGHGKVVHAV
jgi:Phage integrase, N-terminal SAM-like domain